MAPGRLGPPVLLVLLLLLVPLLFSSRADGAPAAAAVPGAPGPPRQANDSSWSVESGHGSLPGHTKVPKGDWRLSVLSIDYSAVQYPLEVTLWIMLASIAKIGFHLARPISTFVPESCLLVIMGLLVGAVIRVAHPPQLPSPDLVFGVDAFFLYLLPPLMLDSGYFLPTRQFMDNIGTIISYSVFGTLWNALSISLFLFGICQISVFNLDDIPMLQLCMFGSVISAVDPISVIAVFEQIQVNDQLQTLVFGESLLNDAVTVALYQLFLEMCDMQKVLGIDVAVAILRVVLCGLGGIVVGLFYGFLAAFASRFTHRVSVLEPLFVFLFAYLAYLTAEMSKLSGIMAIVSSAVLMRPYVEANISYKSRTTIRYAVKTLSSVSETLIFMFLGVSTVSARGHEWNGAFICFTLIACLSCRIVGVLVITYITNKMRLVPLGIKEQFVIAYGGLRGAVCFSLVFLLPTDPFVRKSVFLTASIAVIFFTVFVQGTTIRPLLQMLDVERRSGHVATMAEEIAIRSLDHLVIGMEDICGHYSHNNVRERFEKFNRRFLWPLLVREDAHEDSHILGMYRKLEMKQAMQRIDMFRVPSTASVLCLEERSSVVSGQSVDERPKDVFGKDDRMKDIRRLLNRSLYRPRKRISSYSRHYLPTESQETEVFLQNSNPEQLERRLRRHGTLPARSTREPPHVRPRAVHTLERSKVLRPRNGRDELDGGGETQSLAGPATFRIGSSNASSDDEAANSGNEARGSNGAHRLAGRSSSLLHRPHT
ncbi:unnamed protein product [Lampetra fluviatilis]